MESQYQQERAKFRDVMPYNDFIALLQDMQTSRPIVSSDTPTSWEQCATGALWLQVPQFDWYRYREGEWHKLDNLGLSQSELLQQFVSKEAIWQPQGEPNKEEIQANADKLVTLQQVSSLIANSTAKTTTSGGASEAAFWCNITPSPFYNGELNHDADYLEIAGYLDREDTRLQFPSGMVSVINNNGQITVNIKAVRSYDSEQWLVDISSYFKQFATVISCYTATIDQYGTTGLQVGTFIQNNISRVQIYPTPSSEPLAVYYTDLTLTGM